MSALLVALAKVNNFTPYRNSDQALVRQIYNDAEEQDIADELDSIKDVMSYVEHLNWVNFTKFELPKPIYINLVRHPIQKVMSAYYYIRQPTVHAYYVKRNQRPPGTKEYFETTFNDCVKQAKLAECIFDSHINYNSDWRRFSMHFCGNRPECK